MLIFAASGLNRRRRRRRVASRRSSSRRQPGEGSKHLDIATNSTVEISKKMIHIFPRTKIVDHCFGYFIVEFVAVSRAMARRGENQFICFYFFILFLSYYK